MTIIKEALHELNEEGLLSPFLNSAKLNDKVKRKITMSVIDGPNESLEK